MIGDIPPSPSIVSVPRVDGVPAADTTLVDLDLDTVRTDDIVAVADWPGPSVTLEIDSRRHGIVAPDGPRRAKSLIDRARRTLEHASVDGAPVPGPVVRDLVTRLLAVGGDPDTWRHGADGTVIIATPERFGIWRTGPIAVDRVDVGLHPRIRPLLRLTTGIGPFTVLALSLDEVRILRGDRTTLEEVPLGRTPRSIADGLWFHDEERRLNQHSSGSGTEAVFHGHGTGGEHRNERVGEFISMVHSGLVDVLASRHALDQPVIVAGVAEHLAALRSVSTLPDLVAEVIGGNHELRTDHEIHRRAIEILAGRRAAPDALARHARLAGTGLTLDLVDDIRTAAETGRIDQLILESGVERWAGDGELSDEIIDRVIVETLRRGGEVVEVAPGSLGLGTGLAALTRW